LKDTNADVYAKNIRLNNGSYLFDIVIKEEVIEDVELNMGGLHNIENAVAAIAIASSLQIGKEKIKAAVASFKGVKRRFEYIIKNDQLIFIDDYAHHPEELRALINGAKNLFSDKKCTIIFQPHLYTRTRDLANEFAEVLDMADEVVLLPIYPARELPIEGVSSEMIAGKMKNANKRVVRKEALIDWVKSDFIKNRNTKSGDVLVTAGAGDIDTLLNNIKETLV
jgi:UDP-N-acetylmuramate--alanine ligase